MISCAALGQLDDLGLRRLAHGLLPRLAEQAVLLPLGLGQHFLAFLDDPAGLLDLFRDRGAHLVEQVVDLLAINAHVFRQRNLLRVVDQVIEFVDQYEDVHGKAFLVGQWLAWAPSDSSAKRTETCGGTISLTLPPKRAISLMPEELMKLTFAEDIM